MAGKVTFLAVCVIVLGIATYVESNLSSYTYAGKRYEFVAGLARDWHFASLDCIRRGGRLPNPDAYHVWYALQNTKHHLLPEVPMDHRHWAAKCTGPPWYIPWFLRHWYPCNPAACRDWGVAIGSGTNFLNIACNTPRSWICEY